MKFKYWVTDDGIKIIGATNPEAQNPENSVFETFEEAALFAIESLSSRVNELLKAQGEK